MSILTKLYSKSPILIQNIGVSLYGLKREWDRYGKGFSARVDYFRSIEFKNNKFIEEYQLQELTKLLSVAEESEYYSEIFRKSNFCRNKKIKSLKSLKEIPILEKEFLRGNEEKFYTTRIKKSLSFKTSGSTGSPLKIKMNKEDFRDRIAMLERLRLNYGVNRKMKFVTFVGKEINAGSKKKVWRHNIFGRQLVMSVYDLSEENNSKYLKKLEQYNPQVIEGYPSALCVIAQWMLNSSVSLNAKAVFVTAETLSNDQKNLLKKAFKCPVVNYYGSSEGSIIISECEFEKLHLNYESGIIEFLRDDGMQANAGELANMVITSFSTKATPLIRYNIGDMAIYSDEVCKCGRESLIVKEIVGRVDDIFETPFKGRVGRLSTSLKLLPSSVKKAQIQQHSPTEFLLLVETSEKITDIYLKETLNDLKSKLGNVSIKTKVVEEILVGKNGKFRSQINLSK